MTRFRTPLLVGRFATALALLVAPLSLTAPAVAQTEPPPPGLQVLSLCDPARTTAGRACVLAPKQCLTAQCPQREQAPALAGQERRPPSPAAPPVP
ncbi:hypothetical protein ACIQM4_32280 [Streptomyces sp. NPDC091272]|uniref:hypothetical protein n=1 Tax=Streptomyces sp. NPDC091272 TaxID=3365981 RepID=UPI00380F21EC